MRRYDATIGALRPYRALLDEVCARLIATDEPAVVDPSDAARLSPVLDLGCGTGNLLLALRRHHGPRLELIGVERSAEAIELAQHKLGADPRARLVRLDLDQPFGAHLPIASGAVCCNVLYGLADPAAFLRQVREQLAEGARFVLTNPFEPSPERVLLAHREACAAEVDARPDAAFEAGLRWMDEANRRIAAEARSRRVHFLDPAALRHHLETAGFEVERITTTYAGVNLIATCHAA